MKGHDVVIAIMGGFPAPDQQVITNFSEPARQFIPAMRACGIKRYFTVFGAGFLGAEDQIPKDWQDDGNPEMVAINKIRRDMRIQWDLIVENELDFTIWCPANYPAGPRSSEYEIGHNSFVGVEVTTGMVADSIVKEISDRKMTRVRVGITRKDKQ